MQELDIQHSCISMVENFTRFEILSVALGARTFTSKAYIQRRRALTLMMETVIFLLRPFHFSFPRAPHSEETRRDAEG